MRNLHKAVFIGVSWGIVFIIFLARLAGPQLAYASTLEPFKPGSGIFAPLPPAAAEVQNDQDPGAESEPVNPNSSESPSPQASSGCSLSASFPDSVRRWCDYLERYAAENGLDPNLIASVMLQESGGDPDATSHSGAVGLLQVMPRDGIAASFQCINGPCFASRPSMAELYDPEFNIRFGVGMLAGLLNRHGDVRETLRSYGPGDAGYSYADKVLAIYERYK
jgi:hypothetical protein